MRLRVFFAFLTYLTITLTAPQCAFYCFVNPTAKEVLDISQYRNLPCTHFVYGFAELKDEITLKDITVNDHMAAMSIGNLRRFLGLRSYHPSARLLLGIRRPALFPIRDGKHARNVATIIVEAAKKRRFDGIFIHIEGSQLASSACSLFLGAISTASASLPCLPTLGLSSRWMWRAASRLRDLSDHVEHMYLMMEELPSSEDPYSVTHIDPLHQSESIPIEDSISGCTHKMMESGVPAEKIVVGLSCGAKTYTVHDPSAAMHGGFAMKAGIRRSWQDICGNNGTLLDKTSASLTIEMKTSWTSANSPELNTLGRKISWISQEGFGGIGFSSLQWDDPSNKCGNGPFPAHSMVNKLFRCRSRMISRHPSISCTRFCYLDSDRPRFDLFTLQPFWCSHLVVGPVEIQFSDVVKATANTINLLKRIEQWRAEIGESAPKVILSIGAQQTNDVWRVELANSWKRQQLVKSIENLILKTNASGVEISWLMGNLDGTLDSSYLSSILVDLKKTLPPESILMLAATPVSSFGGRYDIEVLKNTTDFIVLHSHRFHSPRQTFTGHHSPMFQHSEILPDRKMTVEGLVNHWMDSGIPKSRLLLSVTAEAMSVSLIGERSDYSTFYGLRSFPQITPKSVDGRIISQTQICEAKNDNGTLVQWLDELAVPFLFRHTEFVAFDNEKSVRIKATWSSLNSLGGLAIHGLEMDNPRGECPDRPFPILQTIVDTQVCSSCASESKTSCSYSFKVACTYRLQDKDEDSRLSPERIPFEKCTEVVVEQAELDKKGIIKFSSRSREEEAKKVTKLRSLMGSRGLVISLKCNMGLKDFIKLLTSKRQGLVSSIESFLKKYSFTGVELRCADIVSRETKVPFANFLRHLNKNMNEAANERDCPNTVSLRLSAWMSSLRSMYDLSVLNSLHHVVLEPFTVPLSTEAAFVNSPLFKVEAIQDGVSIDTTIREWESAGLNRSQVLVQIPSYGMEQTLKNSSDPGVGKPTEKKYSIIGQSELCHRLKYAGTDQQMRWDSMTTNAWTTEGRWISLDNQQTVFYKMRYCLREGLAGVGLMSLNEDDHVGTCGSGIFPILHSISTKCH